MSESKAVVDTKIDGYIAMTHLWVAEAVYANAPLHVVHISSRQAIDPGPGVPGYCIANWAVLALPKVLRVNLGDSGAQISACSVLYPFVRTGMTAEYATNARLFDRWQPRMLETSEAALLLLQLLALPREEIAGRLFQLNLDANEVQAHLRAFWSEVQIAVQERALPWAQRAPLTLPR